MSEKIIYRTVTIEKQFYEKLDTMFTPIWRSKSAIVEGLIDKHFTEQQLTQEEEEAFRRDMERISE